MGEQSDNFSAMLTTISGTYDKGVVSLDERPVLSAPAKVIVTFLSEPMPQATELAVCVTLLILNTHCYSSS